MKLKNSIVITMIILMITAMIIPAALASSVDVSVVDVTAPTGAVSLAPGASGSITINMAVTGNQVGTATFEVYRDWTLSGGTFVGSNPQEFTVPPRAAQDPPTTFSTTGTVTVASGQAPGTFTLAVSAFDITNSNPTGAKLSDGKDSNYEVTVLAPVDVTPPVIAKTVTGTLGNNGWYISDVTVTFSASDPESTVTTNPSSNPYITLINYDTTGVTISYSATSAGGTATDYVTIKRDTTAPSIVASRNPAANSFGWNNVDVTVSFAVSDDGSGIADLVDDVVVSTEGEGQSVTRTVYDLAGNSASATMENINIDKTPPTIEGSRTPEANAFGWNNVDVTVSFTASDALSGIDTYSDPTTLSIEGASQSVTGTATDKAGNSATATVGGINIDKTAPTITAQVSPSANSYGWNNGPVTVSFSVSDALSDIDPSTIPSTVVLSDEGAGQSATGSVSDKAGNTASATASGINIDKTAPTITSNLVNLGVYPKGTSSILQINYNDALSGIAIETESCNKAQNVILEAGVYNLVASVEDKAGNAQTLEIMFVVYDPSAGFVTGGGWIMSPAGAYVADDTRAGKATFGFVSKYQKGATIPTGNTEFQFHAAGMNFKSTSYDWLVVAGSKAMYKGVGTINGEGNYGFMLSAIDGGSKGADFFRIQIWDKDNADAPVYDNMIGQDDLAGQVTTVTGSIVVHSK